MCHPLGEDLRIEKGILTFMCTREKFLLFVYLGAIARDMCKGTRTSELIVQSASKIQEKRIPPNTFNAAQVFVAFMDGRTRRHRWMTMA